MFRHGRFVRDSELSVCICKKERSGPRAQCTICKKLHHHKCVLASDEIPKNWVCPECTDPHLEAVRFDTTRAAWRARYRVDGAELRCGGYYRCPYEAARALNWVCYEVGVPQPNPQVGMIKPYRLKRNAKHPGGRKDYEDDFVIDDNTYYEKSRSHGLKRRTKHRRSSTAEEFRSIIKDD